MRVLVALDKFKDALGAPAACGAVARGLAAAHPDWTLDLCPLTDGGEGFVPVLTAAAGGRVIEAFVTGPRGGSVKAGIGLVENAALPAAARRLVPGGRILAVVELAAASGLALLPPARRDPWHTTTAGTGELLRLAWREGADAIILGIGGSATNDLGLGALAALGCRFLRADGSAVPLPSPATWAGIERIVRAGAALPPLAVACDVANPLLGPGGATATFGPQKGLPAEDVPRLEAAAARMAGLLAAACGHPTSLADQRGTGAAGGIAFGLVAAYDTRLIPGSDLVSAWLDLPARLAAADLVVTGEGRFDATSLAGKGPGALVREARKLGKRCVVLAGGLGTDPGTEAQAITPAGLPLAEALPRTAEFLEAAAARLA